jgi:hypothetical protein
VAVFSTPTWGKTDNCAEAVEAIKRREAIGKAGFIN